MIITIISLMVSGLGYLEIGNLQSYSVFVMILLCVFGTVRNLTLKPFERSGKGIFFLGLLYLSLLCISVYLNTTDLRTDVYVLLPGIFTFMYFITARSINYKFIVGALLFLGCMHASLSWFQLFLTDLFDSWFSPFMEGASSYSNYHFAAGRMTGLWLEAPRLGTFLAAIFPFAFLIPRQYSKARFLILVYLALSVLVTITRISLFAMLISFFLMTPKEELRSFKRYIPVAAVIIIIFVILLATPYADYLQRLISESSYEGEIDDSAGGYNRMAIYLTFLPMLFSIPFFGIGSRYQNLLASGFTSVHNSILQSILTFGIPATVLLFLILWSSFVKIRQLVRDNDRKFGLACLASALAILVNGLFHGVVFDLQINLLFWMGLGIGLRKMDAQKVGGQ